MSKSSQFLTSQEILKLFPTVKDGFTKSETSFEGKKNFIRCVYESKKIHNEGFMEYHYGFFSIYRTPKPDLLQNKTPSTSKTGGAETSNEILSKKFFGVFGTKKEMFKNKSGEEKVKFDLEPQIGIMYKHKSSGDDLIFGIFGKILDHTKKNEQLDSGMRYNSGNDKFEPRLTFVIPQTQKKIIRRIFTLKLSNGKTILAEKIYNKKIHEEKEILSLKEPNLIKQILSIPKNSSDVKDILKIFDVKNSENLLTTTTSPAPLESYYDNVSKMLAFTELEKIMNSILNYSKTKL